MWWGENHGRGSRAVRSLLRNSYFESSLSASMTYQDWVAQLIADDDQWQWQSRWDSWRSWDSWWSSSDNWDQSHEWHPSNEQAGAQLAGHWPPSSQVDAAADVQDQQPLLGATCKAKAGYPAHETAWPMASQPPVTGVTAAHDVHQGSSSSGSADGVGHVPAPWHFAARGSVAAQVVPPWHQTRDSKRSKPQHVQPKTPSPELSPITEADDEAQQDDMVTVEIDIKCEAEDFPHLPDYEELDLNDSDTEQLLQALNMQVEAANASCNMRGK